MKPYRVPQLAEKYMNYDMIQNHTQLPSFPDARVHLLYIFLKNSGRNTADQEELYALVTSLVQLGLDTHESIDATTGSRGESQMRSLQLKVLAGDYFSGRFYQLLAQSGSISVISLLSRAVSDVNVMKMNLYSKMREMKLTAEEYLKHMVQLNMQLFLSFASLLEEAVQDNFKALLTQVSQCETLIREMDRCSSPETGRQGYGYWYLLEQVNDEERRLLTGDKSDAKDWRKLVLKHKVMERLLDKLRESVQAARQLIPGRHPEGQFELMLEPFLKRLGTYRTVVSEG